MALMNEFLWVAPMKLPSDLSLLFGDPPPLESLPHFSNVILIKMDLSPIKNTFYKV
jgi:hypothetical protein